MATDEPDLDPVSQGLEQLRTRSGAGYGVPPPSPGTGKGRPRATKGGAAGVGTRIGPGKGEPVGEQRSGSTVLASPVPEPAAPEEQGERITRLVGAILPIG